MMGKPVVRGTRITVEAVVDALAAGETFDQLLDEYPVLTDASIRAALAFAAASLRLDFIVPLPSAS
jgi:uncharacterized protein (DUF433 family)